MKVAWHETPGKPRPGIRPVESLIDRTPTHHRTRTFKEEYLAFLNRHGGNFDKKYLWG
jgi:hypothetical protein